MSRRSRVSVNALVLHSLVGIGAGSVQMLRRDERVGQADQLELAVVAVEESMRPVGDEPEVPQGYLLVARDAWNRIEGVFRGESSLAIDATTIAELVEDIGRNYTAANAEVSELTTKVEKLEEYRDGDFAYLRTLCGELGLSVSSWDVITARAKFLTSEAAKVETLEQRVTTLAGDYQSVVDDLRAIAEVVASSARVTLYDGERTGDARTDLVRLLKAWDLELEAAAKSYDQYTEENANLKGEIAVLTTELENARAEAKRLGQEAQQAKDLAATALHDTSSAEEAHELLLQVERQKQEIDGLRRQLEAKERGETYVDRPVKMLEPQELLEQQRGQAPKPQPNLKPWTVEVAPEEAVRIARLLGQTPTLLTSDIVEQTGHPARIVNEVRNALGVGVAKLRGMMPQEREKALEGYLANWQKRAELAKEPAND